MKLGIMQPYFFPYLGYFQLIKATDKWVVFDVVQYMRHHWMNRNRTLHPKADWQYVTVPLSQQPRETLIKDIQIAKGLDWKARMLGQLGHYRKKAPHFKPTMDFLKEALYDREAETESLTRLNVALLAKTCERLGIRFEYEICSEMGLDLSEVSEPGEWALNISDAMKADEYINPYGGAELFDPEKYRMKGIELKFLTPKLTPYHQKGCEFVPGLSIIDVMMWNSLEKIEEMLNEYEITTREGTK